MYPKAVENGSTMFNKSYNAKDTGIYSSKYNENDT
jgi:hypothetical protein